MVIPDSRSKNRQDTTQLGMRFGYQHPRLAYGHTKRAKQKNAGRQQHTLETNHNNTTHVRKPSSTALINNIIAVAAMYALHS